MQQVPVWRMDPEPVWIKCYSVKAGPHLNEMIVQFKINGDEFIAFVPEQYVNRDNCTLQGFIVAEVGTSFLVDLPRETLTSGPRIRVPEGEKDRLILANT